MSYQDEDSSCHNNNNNTTNMSSVPINSHNQTPLPPPQLSQQQHHHHQEQQQQQQHHHHGMTKAELRKSNKPIMEKKRRARINHCLNELKTLILEAMRKDPARHTKLEKADILEMTVKHLQTIQRQQLVMAVSSDPTVVHKFKSGFADCAEEVNRYITQLEGLDIPVKQRLMNHLNNCVSGLEHLHPFNFGNGFGSTITAQIPSVPHHQPTTLSIPQDVNNNNARIQMGGVQFIPSRLPTGELALVMPNSSSLPFFPTTNFTPTNSLDLSSTFPRVSAFNAVTKSRPHGSSPPLSPISSISSMGEDSSPPNDYNSSITTPPLQVHSQAAMMNTFPTPPSGGSTGSGSYIQPSSVPLVSSLQQPHISSTTETPKTSNIKDLFFVTKKRPYPKELSDSSSSDSKLMKLDLPEHGENDDQNDSESMWRPW